MSVAELERHVAVLSRPPCGDRRLRSLAPLVVDDGCDVRIRGGHHADRVRVALLEWLPLTRSVLLPYEGGADSDPAEVLAALVRPPTIWTTCAAVAAARQVDWQGTTRREQCDARTAYALAQVRAEHRQRVRSVAARFGRQLPLEGVPHASAMLAAGCASVALDDRACAVVAATQLARYAASAFVAERRREAAPTMT